MTGQSLFGELKGGTLTHISTGLARRLLDPSCSLLSTLGGGIPFEVAIGMNGFAWTNAAEPAHVVAITTALDRAEHLDEDQCATLAKTVIERVRGAE
jgi:exosome complex component RRP40